MITYFTHSTSTDNEADVRAGWCDPPLSEQGLRQASELRELLKGSKFDLVFSSDLRRAVQTVRIAIPGAEVEFDPRLREMNYGVLNGGHSTDFPANECWSIDSRFETGENCLDVEERVREFISDRCDPGANVAIFSHRYPQLALEVICNGVSWRKAIYNDWRNKGEWQPGWVYRVPV